jgi:nitrate/TMAO reductase-like tetraheme cytochrome c subunit
MQSERYATFRDRLIAAEAASETSRKICRPNVGWLKEVRKIKRPEKYEKHDERGCAEHVQAVRPHENPRNCRLFHRSIACL